MRKYLLPLAVCLAVGAIVVVLVKMGQDEPGGPRDKNAGVPGARTNGEKPDSGLRPRKTRTELGQHHWLSEFERALARNDLSHAGWFRQKVCEDIDTIEASEKLSQNLLDAIRKYGIESDDPRRRDLLLPILRVFKHPDVTGIIEQEYFRAKNEDERVMLLEAMARPYHSPETASAWAYDLALNGETAEHREHAFQCIDHFAQNDELAIELAKQIYQSTTRPAQALDMLYAVGTRAGEHETAANFLRERLSRPRPDELHFCLAQIEGWGTEKDAIHLETLAREFPAMGDQLRERARAVREMRKERARAGENAIPKDEAAPNKKAKDD